MTNELNNVGSGAALIDMAKKMKNEPVSPREADGWDHFFALLNYATDNHLSDEVALQRKEAGLITDADLAPYIAERLCSPPVDSVPPVPPNEFQETVA